MNCKTIEQRIEELILPDGTVYAHNVRELIRLENKILDRMAELEREESRDEQLKLS